MAVQALGKCVYWVGIEIGMFHVSLREGHHLASHNIASAPALNEFRDDCTIILEARLSIYLFSLFSKV